MTPEYWEGYDRVEQTITELECRIPETQERWQWGVRSMIAELNRVLEARSLGHHLERSTIEHEGVSKRRCTCGLMVPVYNRRMPFSREPGHIDWLVIAD